MTAIIVLSISLGVAILGMGSVLTYYVKELTREKKEHSETKSNIGISLAFHGTPALIPEAPIGEAIVRIEEGVEGNGRVQLLKLKRGVEVIIGTDRTSDVVVKDKYASRKHASVGYGEDGWKIRDEYSRNGLIVDGQDVSKSSAKLRDGSVVKLGKKTKLRFYGLPGM